MQVFRWALTFIASSSVGHYRPSTGCIMVRVHLASVPVYLEVPVRIQLYKMVLFV